MKKYVCMLFLLMCLCSCNKTVIEETKDSIPTLESEDTIIQVSTEETVAAEYSDEEILNIYMHIELYSEETVIECDDSIEEVPRLKELLESWEYKIDSNYFIARNDSRVVCFGMRNHSYNVDCLCIDSQTGNTIILDDIVDKNQLFDKVVEKVSLKYENSEEILSEFDESNFNWFIGYDRLYVGFGFVPFENNPNMFWDKYYVEILIAECPELFNLYYFETPNQYTVDLISGYSTNYDIDRDGEIDSFIIEKPEVNYDDLSYLESRSTLRINDVEYSIDSNRYYYNAKMQSIIHVNDKDYLVCCLDIPEREIQYNIYSISNNQIELICVYNVFDISIDFSNPNKIKIFHPCPGLFHLPGYKYAHITDEGELVLDSEYQYAISFFGEQEPMIADFDISGVEVDEDGNVLGDYTITSGSSFILYRTSLYGNYDEEVFNDLKSDEHIVRISYEVGINEWGNSIFLYNGMREYEYYEHIQNYPVIQW